VAAKYAKHAEIHFKRTGKHLGVVNGTTLGSRSDSAEVYYTLADPATWFGEIVIGAPSKKYSVQFDSGYPTSL